MSSSTPATIVLFTAAAVVAGDVAMNLALYRDEADVPRPNVLRFVVKTSLLGASACLALVGLHVLLGSWLLLAVVVAVSGSRHLLRLGDRRIHRRSTASPSRQGNRLSEANLSAAEGNPPPGPCELRSWSDAELCRAWCSSFAALQNASWQTARVRIVEERQRYLDELERRNAEGFMTWLASGATAGDNQRSYLMQGETLRHQTIDWIKLIPRPDR